MNKINIKTLVLGEIGTNCYLVCNQDTKECVIIDPADEADSIEEAVKELAVVPRAVLLTHGHYDHIGAAEKIKKDFDIKIYANELEQEVLSDSYKNLSAVMGSRVMSIEADEALTDGQILELAGFRIRAVSTPGHTKGGMCYLFSLEGGQVLFSGDTLFQGSVGRYDFPTSDGKALFESIKKKLLCLEDDLLVCPGHGAVTSIGEEKPYFFS